MRNLCGAISIDLVSELSFLQHLLFSYSLTLQSDEKTEPKTFLDAYLKVSIDAYSFKIPITAEFTSCTVTSLSFEKQSI